MKSTRSCNHSHDKGKCEECCWVVIPKQNFQRTSTRTLSSPTKFVLCPWHTQLRINVSEWHCLGRFGHWFQTQESKLLFILFYGWRKGDQQWIHCQSRRLRMFVLMLLCHRFSPIGENNSYKQQNFCCSTLLLMFLRIDRMVCVPSDWILRTFCHTLSSESFKSFSCCWVTARGEAARTVCELALVPTKHQNQIRTGFSHYVHKIVVPVKSHNDFSRPLVESCVIEQEPLSYEDRLKIDRLEDRTSLCLVKNENFLCHINVFGTAHQPTVQRSCDHSQMTSFNHLKIG